MRTEVVICDLCTGEEIPAVATYWDGVGTQWDICQKCLEIVKEAGLEYEMLVGQEETE